MVLPGNDSTLPLSSNFSPVHFAAPAWIFSVPLLDLGAIVAKNSVEYERWKRNSDIPQIHVAMMYLNCRCMYEQYAVLGATR